MDGILLIDKPQGITSNRVVQKIKKHLEKEYNAKFKIGHTGTLDFFATGLLIITINKATRLTEYFQGLDKEYEATGELGKITDTYDINGTIIEERKCSIEEDKLIEIIKSFEKTYMQMPPPYSAKRIKGKRAYQLAKKGITPSLKPKKVTIHQIQIVDIKLPFFTVQVKCSSGTYIRSLIKEIGDLAGCGAYVKTLRRISVDSFSVESAVKLEDFLSLNRKEIENLIIPLEKSLPFLPQINLDEGFDRRFITGQRFRVPHKNPETVKVFYKDRFLGIGKIDENSILHPVKVLVI